MASSARAGATSPAELRANAARCSGRRLGAPSEADGHQAASGAHLHAAKRAAEVGQQGLDKSHFRVPPRRLARAPRPANAEVSGCLRAHADWAQLVRHPRK